jgi:glycosyltransferase involved in cell wall biosynthesis
VTQTMTAPFHRNADLFSRSPEADAREHSLTSADRPMRIAVVGGRGIPSTYSGVETIVENLFAHFAAAGHDVTVYCRPGVLDEPVASYRGMRLVRTPAIRGKLETVSHTALSCLHAVRHGNGQGERFDLISFHAIPPNVAQKIPAFAGVPTISHVHGLDHQREKWRGLGARIILQGEREMVKHAAQVVTVNKSLVKYYRDRYGIDAALLPNGIHPVSDTFTPDRATLGKFGLEPGKFIVMISRLVPEKRHGDAIAAFARVNTDCKLVIVGEGNQSDGYVDSIKQQAASDARVVFTGLQKGEALQTLFRCAKLYVTASELEGLPSSLLECMERRVCAIVSDIPPHAEVMEGVAGYDLGFKVGDVGGIRRSIECALANESHSTSLAIRMRTHVRRHYSWPTLAAATEKLYREVLARSV